MIAPSTVEATSQSHVRATMIAVIDMSVATENIDMSEDNITEVGTVIAIIGNTIVIEGIIIIEDITMVIVIAIVIMDIDILAVPVYFR